MLKQKQGWWGREFKGELVLQFFKKCNKWSFKNNGNSNKLQYFCLVNNLKEDYMDYMKHVILNEDLIIRCTWKGDSP